MAGRETEGDRPIPVVLERDEDPRGAFRYWAVPDPARLAECLSQGRAKRAAAGFGEIPETDEGDPRPFGWPSTLSAAEAFRSLAASLLWWGVARGPEDLEVVRGKELLDDEHACVPPLVPDDPSTVAGQAFVAANAGAAVLDGLDPGWHERVDPELVDQETERRNVLALAHGGGGEAGSRMLEDATSRRGETYADDTTLLGLHPADLFVDKDQRELAAECLNLYWRREVEARRRGERPPLARYRYAATVRVTLPVPAGDPWKPPEARVEDLLGALLSDPAVERWTVESGPLPLGDADHPSDRRNRKSGCGDGVDHEDPDVPF